MRRAGLFAALAFGVAVSAYARDVSHAAGTTAVETGRLTYYAASGDTLISIAQKLTSSVNNWSELGRINHIGNDRRIPIGSAIVIPANLLPDDPSEATVSAFSGQVTLTPAGGAQAAVAIGSKLAEGGEVSTGPNSFITFSLPDGSHISLPSNSKVKLATLRMARFTRSPRTEIMLEDGDVESRVSPLGDNKGRYEVHSQLATAGVRGTHFRVAVVGKSIASEVLGGVVAVGTPGKPASVDVTAGKGNIVDADGVGKPVALLPAPELEPGYALQERTIVRFGVTEVAGAVSYHGQIARDEDAQNIVAEVRSQGKMLKVDGLPDGDYFLRFSAIDKQGLEGLPRIVPFKLKARPVPPFNARPLAKLRADHVDFEWIEAPDAGFYHLQVAKDAAFHDIVIDQAQVGGLQFAGVALAPGKYWWRTASVSAHAGGCDHGPFGDAQAFELLVPQKLAPIVDQGGNDFSFNWPSEPGQTFLVQIGRDKDFASLLLEKRTGQGEIRLPRPPAGTYYVRVQATDPDGYVGAFSESQKFTIHSRLGTGFGEAVRAGDSEARAAD
ncbi:MAG TPA: FecR domain-containing protein [Burkholderiaceae bacterium]